MSDILLRVRKELEDNIDEKTKKSYQRFFKEKVKCYGVKTGTVRKIAGKYWDEIKEWDKREIFRLCEDLYSSDYTEEAFVVSFWGMNFRAFVMLKIWQLSKDGLRDISTTGQSVTDSAITQ